MASGFYLNGVDIDNYFMTTTELIDGYVKGALWSWGYNVYGQLGDSTITGRSSPVQTIATGTNWKQVACGFYHTAAIKTDGTLWTWGNNITGGLGDSTRTYRSSPVQTIAGGTNWKQVACGNAHTAAIKTDGTLWSCGYNLHGELGDSTRTHRSSPVQTIAGGTIWKQVACGFSHTAAIKTDGTLWSWGFNAYGELADNTNTSRSSPVQTIAADTNWKQLSCGGSHQTAAIKTDGTLWTWGVNSNFQLGDSTNISRSSPVQTIAGGINWIQVSCGYFHIAAIKTDGTLWTWGNNIAGGLGDNTISDRSSPIQTIATGTNWKQVAGGYFHTAAIKTDGTLWSWGYNVLGQLGDSTAINRSSPIQTIAGGTNWKQVAAGYHDTSAVQYSDIGQIL